ncbi:MAG: glycogen/starch synthase [Woeseiaceae bacterium]|nr:glycogen/starch synthase [Woeseiaceae bacterium]
MLAAENGGLPGGKVGGVGDVLRDLPPALADRGWRCVIVTPEYGLFARLPGARPLAGLAVEFAAEVVDVDVLELPSPADGVRYVVLRSERFQPCGATIYCDDGPGRPFASDATKFALFCAAAATWIGTLEESPDVVHLHDWHAALFVLLQRCDPRFETIRRIRTVFTIHNLALQGVRPMDGDPSSFRAWYPQLDVREGTLTHPGDGRSVNPMAVAIRLADGIGTVSPTYAREIVEPSDPQRGFSGGEGLERELAEADRSGRLHGILNGCSYGARDRRRPGWRRLLDGIDDAVRQFVAAGRGPRPIHDATLERISTLPKRRPRHVLTSICRLTEQKVALFLQHSSEGARAIEKILGSHADDTVIILLGSGDAGLQEAFGEIAGHHRNLLFVCGYSEAIAELLYRAGDLFLMPSLFEPCGIGQMYAMREAQPCIVHEVGGLADTVTDGIDGFSFGGGTRTEKADNLIACVSRAIGIRNTDENRWLSIRDRARSARFPWDVAAQRYIERLYGVARCGTPEQP